MKTETLEIPVITKMKKRETALAASCCTPKNSEASVCCTPNESPEDHGGACCAQPEDGSACCNK